MKKQKHTVLRRQLKRFQLSELRCPKDLMQWRAFLERVNRAYIDLDNERYLSERTQKISNEELQDLYQQLKDKSVQLQSIFDAVNVGIIIVNHKGIMKAINPCASRIFGFSQEQMMNHSFLMTMPTEKKKYFQDDMKNYLISGQSEVVGRSFIESSGLHVDGHIFPLSVAITAIQNNNHPIFVCIMRDITEEKQAKELAQEMNQKLVSTARYVGMAEVAASVLHNIGNVLNSMGVSITLLTAKLAQAKLLTGFSKIHALIQSHLSDFSNFITYDDQGKHFMKYLVLLEEASLNEQKEVVTELESLALNVQHIKNIVSMQQGLGRPLGGLSEVVSLSKQVNSVLNLVGFDENFLITKNYQIKNECILDQVKLMQILMNLIQNAKDAMLEHTKQKKKHLIINIFSTEDERIKIEVIDNGIGISPENMTKIFSFGFSTKSKGHGYGLHTSALMAKEMGGSLSAESKGINLGSKFVLELPDQSLRQKETHHE